MIKNKIDESDDLPGYPDWLLNHTGSKILFISDESPSVLHYGIQKNLIYTTFINIHQLNKLRNLYGSYLYDIIYLYNVFNYINEPYRIINKCLPLVRLGGILSIFNKFGTYRKCKLEIINEILYYSDNDNGIPEPVAWYLNNILRVIYWNQTDTSIDIRYQIIG
ncbi:MAG TPA: hypothetical protein PK024_04550 [Methanospirillum sp.]|uniref:hypothetical protein n=1 Tax=Methanospirillum sp. TaxID=45200 RepID=UPI002C39576E|nr:hypothetical protein [Methanospirillum sp.]HOJ96094.1 hypothetical protein [Methanospirillum sp.]HPP76878.1 hypothetical protein [Methanospirillum sp.]